MPEYVSSDAIVLDFFSGSSTTAEAIFRHNLNFKKQLKFIMAQLPENLDENLETADANTKVIIENGKKILDEMRG